MLFNKEDEMIEEINKKDLIAHKYAIQFDIHPEISYLNHDLLVTIADLLKLFHNFPNDVWISQQSVDEGLDFCRIIFWVFSNSSDALKAFGIWFQSLFREAKVAETLERLVSYSLDEQESVEVVLSDWIRVNALAADVVKAIRCEVKNSVDT